MKEQDYSFFIGVLFVLGISSLIALIVGLFTNNFHPASIIIFAVAGGVGIIAGTTMLIVKKIKFKNAKQ